MRHAPHRLIRCTPQLVLADVLQQRASISQGDGLLRNLCLDCKNGFRCETYEFTQNCRLLNQSLNGNGGNVPIFPTHEIPRPAISISTEVMCL